MAAFRHRRIVEFADTDMAGIVHFATFFRYMEAAEHAYLRGSGLGVFTQIDGHTVTIPRVSARCDYLRPARFTDVLEVEVAVAKVGRTSIEYAFTFYVGADVIARGGVTAVMCRVGGHKIEPYPIPEAMRERLLAGPPAGWKELP